MNQINFKVRNLRYHLETLEHFCCNVITYPTSIEVNLVMKWLYNIGKTN